MHYRSVIIYCCYSKSMTTLKSSRFAGNGSFRRRNGVFRADLFQRVVTKEQNLEAERNDDMQRDEEDDDESHGLRVGLHAAYVSQTYVSRVCKKWRRTVARTGYTFATKNQPEIRNARPVRIHRASGIGLMLRN